jgi:hypothetical protein
MSYNDEFSVTSDTASAAGDRSLSGDRPAGRGREPRHDGWTLDRQHDFLADLGGHGNVTRAAGAVGLSPSSAYRLRAREAAFAAGWRAATAMAYQRLRDLAFERIENGTVQTVFYKGELAGTRLVFSDRLLLGMLDHLKPDGCGCGGGCSGAGDPADAYAAALDAFAVALENGTEPVLPAAAAPAEPADVRPSPGEGPYHDARVAAAQDRLARGEDPFVPRFPGRIYPPHPDAVWLDAYPDGLTADDLAREDPAELALVGLSRAGARGDEMPSRA